jgi:hypothetical protein
MGVTVMANEARRDAATTEGQRSYPSTIGPDLSERDELFSCPLITSAKQVYHLI